MKGDFKVDDIIELTNRDVPAWATGLWRVYRVEPWGVQLLPVLADRSADCRRPPVTIIDGQIAGGFGPGESPNFWID